MNRKVNLPGLGTVTAIQEDINNGIWYATDANGIKRKFHFFDHGDAFLNIIRTKKLSFDKSDSKIYPFNEYRSKLDLYHPLYPHRYECSVVKCENKATHSIKVMIIDGFDDNGMSYGLHKVLIPCCGCSKNIGHLKDTTPFVFIEK